MSYLTDVAAAIRDELAPDLVPDVGGEELLLLYALLAVSVGRLVNREHVHDAWAVWKTLRAEQHDNLVPYAQLSGSVQLEDEPYAQAIRSVAAELNR